MSQKKKQIRQQFRDSVFSCDKFKCVFCYITENLDAHHITDRNEMPNGGYVKENGITLCHKHHADAEVWHQFNGELWEDGMTPNDLYHKIGSSLELAIKESKKLNG